MASASIALVAAALLMGGDGQTEFSGCGVFQIGPQSCTTFHANNGEVYWTSGTGGIGFNTQAFVTGTVIENVQVCPPLKLLGNSLVDITVEPCPEFNYSACGEILLAIECGFVFVADDGSGAFILDNLGGFDFGDQVFVEGTINTDCPNPNPKFCNFDCLENNTIAECVPTSFDGYGTLVQGIECLIFQADNGESYQLDNYGDFGNGDRVRVMGMIDDKCQNFCFLDCIVENTIEAAVDVCGQLVQSSFCTALATTDGQTFLLENLGDFSVGDRVTVTGVRNLECVSICFLPCLDSNVIGPLFDGDFTCDNIVSGQDLLMLLNAWGDCPREGACIFDLNGDEIVSGEDLLILLNNWG